MENDFKVELEGTTLTVTLGKKLWTDNAPALVDELNNYIGKDIEEVAFDASGLSFISSAGIRAIFFTYQRIGIKPEIVFINCVQEIRSVIDHVGLTSIIKFKESAELKKKFRKLNLSNMAKVEINQLANKRKEEIEKYESNNDVVCYTMKLGQEDE